MCVDIRQRFVHGQFSREYRSFMAYTGFRREDALQQSIARTRIADRNRQFAVDYEAHRPLRAAFGNKSESIHAACATSTGK